MRRPITACLAVAGLLAVSVVSCSKLDEPARSAPAAPPQGPKAPDPLPRKGADQLEPQVPQDEAPTTRNRRREAEGDRWGQRQNELAPPAGAAVALPVAPPPAEDKPRALKLEAVAQSPLPASGEAAPEVAEESVDNLLGALDGRKAKPKVAAAPEPTVERAVDQPAAPPAERTIVTETEPEAFLPRMFYFENTYLGGNAAFTRRLLALDQVWPGGDRPYARAAGPRQPFDAPPASGLGLTVNLDRGAYTGPGRVYLQIGLQGSPRFGWRRPPLDLVMVVDAAVLTQGREAVDALAREALRRLEPTDRLAIVLAGDPPRMLVDLAAPRDLRTALARALDALPAQAEPGTPGALGAAIRAAGERLRAGAGSEARVPGAQEVLVLARAADIDRVAPAAEAAHEIGLAGVITSVVRFDAPGEAGLPFWDIAQAGQGNLRALPFGAPAAPMITAELADLSRVVARLIRVNVRLGAHTSAVRVLGSRMLDRDEVVRVKAREVAVDRNLSKTLGVKSDRGEDDDGIQTVIPYFYGGDTHVMALELWVDGPGPVADVSLKYKDMVSLGNATSRAGVGLSATPRPPTGAEAMVRRNIEAFENAERLAQAAARVEAGDTAGAAELLAQIERRSGSEVARALGATLRGGGDPAAQSEALRLAAARSVGVFETAP